MIIRIGDNKPLNYSIYINVTPEHGIIRRNIYIYISSSSVVYFSDNLPSKSPILKKYYKYGNSSQEKLLV